MIFAGIDNIESVHALLQGRRIGLMTNPTGVDSSLRSVIDILNERYRLCALFACEHGVRGDVQAGVQIENMVDPETGVPVFSLFGRTQRMSREMLDLFDVLVFDMQDVGARFYTYLYSLAYAMQECAAAGKSVVVLDRPNPLGGERAEGEILEEKLHSFVGEFAMPTRYGLTIGEYALWVKEHLSLDLDLHIAPMLGWKRSMQYEDTGLCFVPPSPNCATLHAARVYIGTCIFEGTNVSEGRGTVLPFEYIGAPYIDAARLEKRLRETELPGVRFRRACFTPQFHKHAGRQCAGVQIHLTDLTRADVFAAGLFLLDTIREMHKDEFEWTGEGEYKTIDRLLGTDAYRLGLASAQEIMDRHAKNAAKWHERTKHLWLYE